uniref:PlsC domain-containing protein n=1 Tax=Steinernema glaseri TaxID=37863 RepID=A0A1I8A0C5_9BILA
MIGAEHLLLFVSAFLFPPIIITVILVVLLASFGKSFGIRERYVDLLIKLFEWGARQIHTTAQQKKQNSQSNAGDLDGLDEDFDEQDTAAFFKRTSNNGLNQCEARPPYDDSDGGFTSDSGVTFGSPISHGSSNSLRHRHGSGTSIIRREASVQYLNDVDTETSETVVNSRGWAVINDSVDFVKAGMEAIIEDEVTSRFEAEQLASWNMLTRNSITFYQFVNWKLTALWVLGFIVRYVCLFPLRICLFGIGLLFLIFSTAIIGLVPEGELKRNMNKRCMLICHRILSRSLSAVVYFHDQRNKASEGGICVANHTSPLDVTILSTDNVYALIGQRQPGLLGLMQRAISRASAHIFFERSEVRDRALVTATMREHVNDPHKLPILIFPEGTCINNTSVMMFKKGSFEVGTKIYPIAMKYDSRFGDAFWNSSEQGWLEYIMRMMTSWAIICNVWYLPPMEKMEGEDAIDFASRVKKTIAKRGGLVDLDWDGGLKRAKVPKKMVTQQQDRYFHRMARYTSYSEKPKEVVESPDNDLENEDPISFVAKAGFSLQDLPEDTVADDDHNSIEKKEPHPNITKRRSDTEA